MTNDLEKLFLNTAEDAKLLKNINHHHGNSLFIYFFCSLLVNNHSLTLFPSCRPAALLARRHHNLGFLFFIVVTASKPPHTASHFPKVKPVCALAWMCLTACNFPIRAFVCLACHMMFTALQPCLVSLLW